MIKDQKNAFTLVELLSVIVILSIILVIAVPKVMNVIEDAKKATLESTVKMIASAAEKAKVQNTLLGKNDEITCESVAKINDVDYDRCIIEFDNDGNTKVTIKGNGKFEGLYVCNGTKTSAVAMNESCSIEYGIGSTYIEKLLAQESTLNNGLVQTSAEYEGKEYDAGIRYVGENPNNKVYYNCYDTDINGVSYGYDNYDYASSCEVWRIIGVFDVNNGMTTEKRIKLVNTNSTFKASWDSSSQVDGVNNGHGINQWGESIYEDGTYYEGSDLMRLLNGYYIGKSGSTCTYCTGYSQETCSQICTSDELKVTNMKVLTNTAKNMIDNAVWDTYGVMWSEDKITVSTFASNVYLQEKGISAQYTGKDCQISYDEISGATYCNDGVIRTTKWTGLVGLINISDVLYANGWAYSENFVWIITPRGAVSSHSAWRIEGQSIVHTNVPNLWDVWPSLYLKPSVEIIDGNGDEVPYKLK